ncbi:MAG TPA: ROK family glucokinase [Phycisphaerae bacterium]|nr:ROK family glucokinase [Phycisphaerae bacterium]
MSNLCLGLDLGGTNIKAGVIAGNSKLIGKVSVSTGVGPDAVIANMIQAAKEAVKTARVAMDAIAAVGIASPGPLSSKRGVVFRSANLPGWLNVPLRERISGALSKPAILENDAKAAAYGEYRAGAGRDRAINDFVMITLGTGVGGGVVQDGKLVHGSFDSAGEFGHMIMVPGGDLCGCGQHGCLEVYAAASRTGQHAMRMLREHPERPSSLRQVMQTVGQVTARDVEQSAQAGDSVALEIWEKTCEFLGLACVNIVHAYDPQMIVLAGGMAAAGDFLLTRVRQAFMEQFWKMDAPHVEIGLAELGNDAGMIGAAELAREAFIH